VAQKKHQMFGKRAFTDTQAPTNATAPEHAPIKYEYDPYGLNSTGMEGAVGPLVGKQVPPFMQHPDIKYPPYTLDFGRPLRTAHDLVAHNHSYPLPPQSSNIGPAKPSSRDKKKRAEEEHLTRDEKRARQLAVPIPCQDIINLPMDEFNERLSKYDLSEAQLSLIRDIRRRGKNKVAAQNCRKRKLDQILSLADEVKEMKMRKERVLRERESAMKERARVKEKYMALYRHVTSNLRDADGNPCSSSQYSLQLSAEGTVVLVPRNTMEHPSDPSARANQITNQPGAATGGNGTHPHANPAQQNQTHIGHHHSAHHYPHHPHHQQKE